MGAVTSEGRARVVKGRLRALASVARIELRECRAFRHLPPRVSWFLVRARLRARRTGDLFAITSSLAPADLARLLRLAGDRTEIAELGTAHGWTAAALALALEDRHVVTFDPVERPERERYLALLDDRARARIEYVAAAGATGPRPVQLLYIDSSHEREETLAEVRAWRPLMPPGSLIVFDDYENPAYPGVTEAVAELGLAGERVGGRLFTHRV